MSNQQQRSTLWDFDSFEKIGSGSFGVVYKVRRKADGRIYALKQVALTSQQQYNETVKEVNILASLNHKHIVRYYDCFSSDNYTKLNIVMEYAKHGTLHDMIQKQNGKYLAEKEIWRLFYHMLQALQYVHGKKILHRDIKAMNVFLDENMDCKLGDFGVSKILDRPLDMTATIIGTPLYMSPELCKNIPYDARSDVWALGCIVYEMCTLLHPFEHVIRDYQKNPLALAQAVTKGAWNRNALVHYSPEMTQIIEQCLAIDPSRRPTVDQLLDSEPLRRQLIRFGLIPNKSPSSSQEGTEVKKHDQQICPPTTQVTPLSSPKVTPPQPIHQLLAHSPQQQQQQHLHIMQPVRITPLPVPQKPNTANAQQVPSYQPYNYNQHMYQPQAPYYINQQPVVQQQHQYYQPAPQQQQQQQQPKVNIPQVQPSQPPRQQNTEVCPFCHGSKIYESAECRACSGQGYIYC